jgi:hypothetical protein
MTKIPKDSQFYGDWNLAQGATEDGFFEELKH